MTPRISDQIRLSQTRAYVPYVRAPFFWDTMGHQVGWARFQGAGHLACRFHLQG
jgi:hypothetical protein